MALDKQGTLALPRDGLDVVGLKADVPRRALVHFAVGSSEVYMCTKLEGADSTFLPFNRGHDFGAGNPPNPNGAPTAYLWEEVWERDSWLEILGRYLVPVRDDKKRLKGWIFPRFHQLDATRKLVAQVLADGPGGKYLIEHSAGSGKTNSIAWTAHFLADLHDAALDDGGEFGIEDLLAAKMASRADQVAFHTYSMRQAIEEKFILDVLKNDTSYKLAFKLTHAGKELDETEVDASAARKGIMGWVRLHPHNIAARVEIVVEHFRLNVAHLLGGQAKAMVVTASRKEAVRWMLAMKAYIARKGYAIGLLVAFSGEVEDPESGPEAFTETNMNPGLKGRDIREAFGTTEFSILLVANKFQTGFDQPLLCAMYVDRRLGGLQAVQTLSRLNRAYPGKDTTYVVDFVNDAETVLEAFRQYHTTAALAGVSDPNVVLDLRHKLDALGFYDQFEVDRVATVAVNPKATQGDLDAAIGPVASRLLTRFRQAQEAFLTAAEGSKAWQEAKDTKDVLLLFKSDLGSYARVYEFLGQMFDYGNTEFEQLYLFAKLLEPLLKFGREREGIDLSALKLTHHRMRDLGQQRLNLGGGGEVPGLKPVTEIGSGQVQDKHKQRLAEIIAAINDLFDGEVTEGDAVAYVDTVLKTKMLESPLLRSQAAANTKEQFANSPSLNDELMNAIMDAMAAHQSMSKQALNSEATRARILTVLMGPGELWEALRASQNTGGLGLPM